MSIKFVDELQESFEQLKELNQKRIDLETKTWEKVIASLQKLINSNTEFMVAEKYPSGIIGVRWTQYTPYFNDGDPCVFRVGSPELLIKPTGIFEEDKVINEDNETEIEFEYLDEWGIGSCEELTDETKESLKNVISSFDDVLEKLETFLENQYGNHVTVHLFTNQVVITGYDHDENDKNMTNTETLPDVLFVKHSDKGVTTREA
jgi:hypothetical protein